MFKSTELVAFAENMLGLPYWYGTAVYECSKNLLKNKTEQYPKHYTPNRQPQYLQDIENRLVCMDCVGLIKGFFWTNGGVGVEEYLGTGKHYENHYQSNGCPDVSADGMYEYCSKRAKHGAIADLPNVPGILLFRTGHVGVYIGGDYAIEARGFNYGVVKTRVSSRGWQKWAYMPADLLEYGEPVDYKLGDRVLKVTSPYMRGPDVVELQTDLNMLGFDCGKVDGIYGKKTENAVKAMQTEAGIEVDGIFGKDSLKALNAMLDKAVKNPDFKIYEYTCKNQDTLWGIAKKFYGSGAKYPLIMQANNMKDDIIHEGDMLKIPVEIPKD